MRVILTAPYGAEPAGAEVELAEHEAANLIAAGFAQAGFHATAGEADEVASVPKPSRRRPADD